MNQVELRLKYSALPRSHLGRVIAWCSDLSLYNFKVAAMLSAGLCPSLFLSLGKCLSEKVRHWPCTPVHGMLPPPLNLNSWVCGTCLIQIQCCVVPCVVWTSWVSSIFVLIWTSLGLLSPEFLCGTETIFQHGVARKCGNDHDAGSSSLPAHTHLPLPSARDASGTLTLPCRDTLCALDCGY